MALRSPRFSGDPTLEACQAGTHRMHQRAGSGGQAGPGRTGGTRPFGRIGRGRRQVRPIHGSRSLRLQGRLRSPAHGSGRRDRNHLGAGRRSVRRSADAGPGLQGVRSGRGEPKGRAVRGARTRHTHRQPTRFVAAHGRTLHAGKARFGRTAGHRGEEPQRRLRDAYVTVAAPVQGGQSAEQLFDDTAATLGDASAVTLNFETVEGSTSSLILLGDQVVLGWATVLRPGVGRAPSTCGRTCSTS